MSAADLSREDRATVAAMVAAHAPLTDDELDALADVLLDIQLHPRGLRVGAA